MNALDGYFNFLFYFSKNKIWFYKLILFPFPFKGRDGLIFLILYLNASSTEDGIIEFISILFFFPLYLSNNMHSSNGLYLSQFLKLGGKSLR